MSLIEDATLTTDEINSFDHTPATAAGAEDENFDTEGVIKAARDKALWAVRDALFEAAPDYESFNWYELEKQLEAAGIERPA